MSDIVYQGLNYLKNTALGNWINLGVNTGPGLEVDMKYNLLQSSGAFSVIFGGRYDVYEGMFMYFARCGSDKTIAFWNGTDKLTTNVEYDPLNTDYRVDTRNGTFKVSNNYETLVELDCSNMGKSFKYTSAMGLFAGRGDFGATLDPGIMKIYYFKLWKNGKLIRDLVPMKRLSDGMCGMFDMVSKTFLISAGGSVSHFTGEVIEKYYDAEGNIPVSLIDNFSKVEYAIETKRLIKESLTNKGVAVSDNDTFRDYANKINEIKGETDEGPLLEIANDILGHPYTEDGLELFYDFGNYDQGTTISNALGGLPGNVIGTGYSKGDIGMIFNGAAMTTSDIGKSYGTWELLCKVNSDFTPVNSSAWYNCSCIMGNEIGDTQQDFCILVNASGNFGIGYANSSIQNTSVKANDGEFHHIVLTYENGQFYLYVDNVQIGSVSYRMGGQIPLKMGIFWNGAVGGSVIKGEIAMFRYYNRVLSAEERTANYNQSINLYLGGE